MKVSEVMTAQVATATPRSTIRDVARTMAEIDKRLRQMRERLKMVRAEF